MAKPEQKKKKDTVMICPKCKSPNIDMDRTNPVQPSLGLPAHVYMQYGHRDISFRKCVITEIENLRRKAKHEGLTDSSPDKTPKTDIDMVI